MNSLVGMMVISIIHHQVRGSMRHRVIDVPLSAIDCICQASWPKYNIFQGISQIGIADNHTNELSGSNRNKYITKPNRKKEVLVHQDTR